MFGENDWPKATELHQKLRKDGHKYNLEGFQEWKQTVWEIMPEGLSEEIHEGGLVTCPWFEILEHSLFVAGVKEEKAVEVIIQYSKSVLE